MNNIDRIFIINFNKEKLKDSKQLLENYNIQNYEIIKFEDFDFSKINKKSYCNFSNKYLKLKKLISNENEYIKFECFLKDSLKNINNLSILKNYKNILILKDNFIFVENFLVQFKKILDNAEENYYGMLYLSDINPSNNKEVFNKLLYGIFGFHDNFSICYNKRIFLKLLELINNSDCELDKILSEHINGKYMAFLSNPILIKKRDNYELINKFSSDKINKLNINSGKFRNIRKLL